MSCWNVGDGEFYKLYNLFHYITVVKRTFGFCLFLFLFLVALILLIFVELPVLQKCRLRFCSFTFRLLPMVILNALILSLFWY